MNVARALLIFAKAPNPGTVKTRLLAAMSPKDAANLHAACVVDTLRLSRSLRGVDVLWFVAGGLSYFRKLLKTQAASTSVSIYSQCGTDLGPRLEHAFRKTFQAGYREIVVIGTDTPWMGAARLRAAFAGLRTKNIVIGPAEDGGYYLLGMNTFVPEVFHKIPWSTERVLKTTMGAIAHTQVSIKMLRVDFDLDRPTDLLKVRQLLKSKPRLAPALAAAIQKDPL